MTLEPLLLSLSSDAGWLRGVSYNWPNLRRVAEQWYQSGDGRTLLEYITDEYIADEVRPNVWHVYGRTPPVFPPVRDAGTGPKSNRDGGI